MRATAQAGSRSAWQSLQAFGAFSRPSSSETAGFGIVLMSSVET